MHKEIHTVYMHTDQHAHTTKHPHIAYEYKSDSHTDVCIGCRDECLAE